MRRLELTPFAKQWFVEQFAQFIGANPDLRDEFDFDVRDFCQFVVLHVYDYQDEREWKHVAHKTARILNYELSTFSHI